jgi:hypothetical protein
MRVGRSASIPTNSQLNGPAIIATETVALPSSCHSLQQSTYNSLFELVHNYLRDNIVDSNSSPYTSIEESEALITSKVRDFYTQYQYSGLTRAAEISIS